VRQLEPHEQLGDGQPVRKLLRPAIDDKVHAYWSLIERERAFHL
jgi:hypothetical protein